LIEIIEGLLPPNERSRVVDLARQLREPWDAVCTRLGLCSEQQIAQVICKTLHLELVTAKRMGGLPAGLDWLSAEFLRANRILPLEVTESTLHVAMVDPTDHEAVRALEFATDRSVHIGVCTATDLEAAWALKDLAPVFSAERTLSRDTEDLERLTDMTSDAPVVRYVNQIVSRAIDLQASDIHLEPIERIFRVRFRLDGMLRAVDEHPGAFGEAVVSRLKIMARLNIAERRLAQDGRFRISVRGQEVDLRMATTPTVHGEAVVLRILDSDRVPLDLSSLGFAPALVARWCRLLDRPHGIVLVTGPTGSGKSTTLYASLTRLNRADRKLLTIEDPVEQQIPGVNQVHAQPAIGFGFAAALRAFLRHDPDIIMVGEIRDQDTARTAIQAALTGHLILSTLHTNDAVSGITRLVDMGIDRYLISSTLLGILGQRLVRMRCQSCGGQQDKAQACPICAGVGYAGRTTIGELLTVTAEMRTLIEQNAGYDTLSRQAIADGMIPLARDGGAKIDAGVTTVEEIARVTLED
jgi:general secretion pathway protein E